VPRPECTSCKIAVERPELWKEVLQGRARRPVPSTYRVISQYLATQGVTLRPSALRDHFLMHKEPNDRV